MSNATLTTTDGTEHEVKDGRTGAAREKKLAKRTAEIQLATDLEDLAAQIQAAHTGYRRTGLRALEYAREAGQRLNEVKGLLKKGEFAPWVEANTDLVKDTAEKYMYVAKNWNLIEEKQDSNPVTSITDARNLIAAAKREAKGGPASPPSTSRKKKTEPEPEQDQDTPKLLTDHMRDAERVLGVLVVKFSALAEDDLPEAKRWVQSMQGSLRSVVRRIEDLEKKAESRKSAPARRSRGSRKTRTKAAA